MKISLIQNALAFGDVDHNFNLMAAEISKAALAKPDVIVLPEMWNTSFFPRNIMDIADDNAQRSKALMSSLAKAYQINLVGGSVARKENGKVYNTAYIFNRSGENIASYNKVHLFSPAGEDEFFEAGNQITTFELDGIRCGIIICYDLRFVEWVRKTALAGIDILFVPAAWPKTRTMHWTILNRARAIENQIFVVSVNSLGSSPAADFGGNSAIIDPLGEYLVEPDAATGIKSAILELSSLSELRDSFNVYRDRKPELYNLRMDRQ